MGVITIEDRAPSWLRALHEAPLPAADALLSTDRPASVANLLGMLRGHRDQPLWMDFLAESAPNERRKATQAALYRRRVAEAGADVFVAPPGRILDLACGPGRFARVALEHGHEVVGIDACRPALALAAGHLARFADRVTLGWGDAEALDPDWLPGPFDAAFAWELLGYLDAPELALRAAFARVRAGGWLLGSVEAWPGALLADPAAADAAAVAARTVRVPADRHVHGYLASELRDLLDGNGWEVELIDGVHYVLDGAFEAMAGDRLDDIDAIEAIEEALRDDPDTRPLPRAWVFAARRAG
jgi:2-polyprenyl-3-methyl-5-hydroxy-6-metoxy-1,4-benzoquinol methylase